MSNATNKKKEDALFAAQVEVQRLKIELDDQRYYIAKLEPVVEAAKTVMAQLRSALAAFEAREEARRLAILEPRRR